MNSKKNISVSLLLITQIGRRNASPIMAVNEYKDEKSIQ
jgi:hypothetical protein